MMFRILRLTWIVCLLFPAIVAGSETAFDQSPVPLTLVPDQIRVGTFYRGAKIDVSADILKCDGAVIIFTSEGENVTLNRKGRVAGIWLNVAQVTVSNAPEAYILETSDELENFCPPEKRQQLGLGEEYLRKRIKFICDEPLVGSEFDEFLRLKTKSGTYNVNIGVGLKPAGSGRLKLTAVLPIPATVPPGTYRVLLYTFKDGEPVQMGMSTLQIEQVGLARLMSRLARNRAALYGVFAVVIAMTAGIGMGIIFNLSRGAGH
jgi:uncharacterized protein (TIGR02186 family)